MVKSVTIVVEPLSSDDPTVHRHCEFFGDDGVCSQQAVATVISSGDDQRIEDVVCSKHVDESLAQLAEWICR